MQLIAALIFSYEKAFLVEMTNSVICIRKLLDRCPALMLDIASKLQSVQFHTMKLVISRSAAIITSWVKYWVIGNVSVSY